MYEYVTIKNGGYTARIRLAGAQIASLTTPEGREIIWQGDPAVWPQHSSILFPICGAPKDGKVIIEGKEYAMNKHGFTKVAPFQVAKLGEDFVELILTPDETTRACYPFDFVFHATYTLLEGGYTTTFLVENKSDRPMPFCVGGHPGYVCPMAEGERFEDYQVVFDKPEEGMHAILDDKGMIRAWEQLDGFHNQRELRLDYADYDTFDTLLFRDLNSRGVNLVHKETGHGLRMVFPKLPALALWTAVGKHAPYLCIEPWLGIPASHEDSGCMEDKPYVVMLEPGRCYKTWFTTTLI
ncbi:MAG: aldose 1-epimerase family protein [Clostridia bacterium]|nr:aldose 1-epimerase family protein [Clostridia bacterium]